jgi:hypothetical protein
MASCHGDGQLKNKLALLCCAVIYLTTVVPSQISLFLSKVSDQDSALSKLSSLRQAVADQNEDTWGQKWGFKLDVFFNTAFVGMLYSLNM